METYEVIPSAKRLIKSLRDMGYDFSTAIADLVDNSIEAGATQVNISVGFYGDESYVRIADNGKGMNGDELKEAMRYGSEREYHGEDLGKFGLGLKTASMSQCRRFSVGSKNKACKNIAIYTWDLAHIEKTNRWEILLPGEESTVEIISAPISEHSGTVVLWEILDRIIGFKDPSGEAARKKLISMCRDLEIYLGMVFHKFIAGEVPGKSLSINLNGNPVQPWDPFARDEKETKALSPIKIKLIHDGSEGKIVLQPYILPSKEKFSSSEAFKRLSGPTGWNQQQGFYIYRAHRLIQSGGWCGLRIRDEHTKLSRIELNFSPAFDSAFKINVAKMRVQLPIQIREAVENAIKSPVMLARDYYDGDKKSSSVASTYVPQNVSKPIPIPTKQLENIAFKPGIPRMFTIDEIEQKVKEIATDSEKKIISGLFLRLRKKLFVEDK
jgi:anti-sigma regulatory factor (Ser/Thr protein kinase)